MPKILLKDVLILIASSGETTCSIGILILEIGDCIFNFTCHVRQTVF